MSIMQAFQNIFSGQQAPNNPGPTPPGNLPPQAPPMIAGSTNGQVPPQTMITNAPAVSSDPTLPPEPKAPFADFTDFWKTPEVDPKAPATGPIQFNIDPAKITQTAQQIDFTRAITPEILAKINAGGPEAMTAMLAAMNTIAQQSFAQAVQANAKITESAAAVTHANIGNAIPDLVRKQTISNALREDNPLFNRPETAPMLQMFEQQLATRFPQATPAQITQYAKQYLTDFVQEGAKAMNITTNGNPQSQAATANSGSDFSNW